MQNWDAMQPTANYEQHNAWYNSMFAANIKTEPGTVSPTNSSPMQSPNSGSGAAAALGTPTPSASHLESYLKQHHQQQISAMDTMAAMTPSPSNTDSMQHFFDTNMQQQLLQQQQYQQQFQQAQQAAAANQVNSPHLPLGFNPLTPPGLPNAVLPPQMSHFYNHNSLRASQQTPSPQPSVASAAAVASALGDDKMQANALTPRNTPPMDVTPPKSPKMPLPSNELEKEHDVMSNSSEDMKYMVESEDDESIRVPIFNSHGKMKNYKCKTCGLVAITKVAFWEHTRSHMKPEKILQCPKCPFVTELKHHLEYHTRKHKNLKPFQCDKCSYTCVNKSMLNSHRKSHSSVYQYRCADCDYATKYCHSFKLHLRKYEHKPGMVLDEEGIPNPSVVIDVYGTRRGPKSKGGPTTKRERLSVSSHQHHQQQKQQQQQQHQHQQMQEQKSLLSNSQLSAALQGFHMPQHQMPASPAKSTSSVASDLPTMTLNMSLQQQQQQQQQQEQVKLEQQQQQQQQQSSAMPNLLPHMAFLPYWNLNLHMLAAQQQAVLAQLSPRMRETAMQQLQNQKQQHQQHDDKHDGSDSVHDEDDDDDEDDEEYDRKSIDSAMDLSQGTPTKEADDKQQTPEMAMNLKLKEETNDTPLMSSMNASRRKGRVLKLDTMLQSKSLAQSPESALKQSGLIEMPTASSPIANNNNNAKLVDEHSSADESMDATPATAAASNSAVISSPTNGANTSAANTSASSTASSSGNSSNSSSSSTSSPAGAIYECKYCDIYFKDAVLYTIHMGYHSCDDVFKCNMCGEKCDGPVGLFVHMARNAHS